MTEPDKALASQSGREPWNKCLCLFGLLQQITIDQGVSATMFVSHSSGGLKSEVRVPE